MIEYVSLDTTRTYYVIFDTYRGARRFWNWFTGKEYAHVYLLTELYGGVVLRINPLCSECSIDEWFCDIQYALDYLKPEVTSILRYTCKYNSLKLYIPRGIISCVSVTKYFLGLRGFNSFLPRSLHKQLLKLGAEEMSSKKQAAAPTQKEIADAVVKNPTQTQLTPAQLSYSETLPDGSVVYRDKPAQDAATKDKAVRGNESAADIAAREQSTLANPKKQQVRGRRSLVSNAIGSGVTASREQLG